MNSRKISILFTIICMQCLLHHSECQEDFNFTESFDNFIGMNEDTDIMDNSTESVSSGTDYCEPDLCKIWNGTNYNYLKHIGCNNTGNFSDICPNDATLVEMNQRRINLLLDLHNAARDRIASGQIDGYKSAENMPILKWDNELQYLASLNVKRCKFAHDACRNTKRFRESGQNIGISWQRPNFNSNSKRMKLIAGLWFHEYKDANQSFIDSYVNHPEGKKIGHFTALVSDRVRRVGCAAIRYSTELRGRAFLITCNYDFNSIYGEPIYKSGPAASNCDIRRSGRYRGLCDWDNDYEDSEESNEIYSNLLNIQPIL